jgi:hypothetical protein
MPVDTQHPEYLAMFPLWERARSAFAGEDSIKAKGESFLPKPSGMTDDEYAAYKERSAFYNATARTASGYIGMIFRRQPIVTYPQSAAIFPTFETDTDLLGTTLEGYAKQIATDVIQVARAGTLIEWSDAQTRPHCIHYRAEDIVNWRTARIDGKSRATLIVLREWDALPTHDDGFATEYQENYRVLRLDQGPTGWEYSTELWTIDLDENKQRTPRHVSTAKALRNGQPLKAIPFVFHGASHNRAEVDKLPLQDLVTLNLSHYRLNADYRHALHYTALPVAWAAGFGKDSSIALGSGRVLMTEDPSAKLQYLEYYGHGLNSFENALEHDERQMAIQGARLLETQKKQAETAEALRIRQGGEESILQNIADTVSQSMTDLLRWVYWWSDKTPKEPSPDLMPARNVTFRLNKDFGTTAMSSDDLKAVVEAYKNGAISRDTLFDLLRKGEILPEGRTNEQEKTLINKEPRKQGVEELR